MGVSITIGAAMEVRFDESMDIKHKIMTENPKRKYPLAF